LYKEVLKQELDLQVDAVRAKRSRYVPTVLTRDEVLAIFIQLMQKLEEQFTESARLETAIRENLRRLGL